MYLLDSIDVFVVCVSKHFDHVVVMLLVGDLSLLVLLDFVDSLDGLSVRFLKQSFMLCFISCDWHVLIIDLLGDESRIIIVVIVIFFPRHFRLFVELVVDGILEWLNALNHFSCPNFVIH